MGESGPSMMTHDGRIQFAAYKSTKLLTNQRKINQGLSTFEVEFQFVHSTPPIFLLDKELLRPFTKVVLICRRS